jgi:hypothetical protein
MIGINIYINIVFKFFIQFINLFSEIDLKKIKYILFNIMPKDMKSDSPKKSRHSKMKKKNNSSDDESEEEVVFMESVESEEEEVPKSGTTDFAKMFQQLGRKYKAKKDDEDDKKNKKKSIKSLSKIVKKKKKKMPAGKEK